MFNFIKSDLEKISKETGFILNSLEKVLRLLDVLDQLSKHPYLKHCFALKGGTALNVFYFDLPRLSVDVDFNYVRAIEKIQMEKDREQIDQLIPAVFGAEYQVTFSKEEYALSQFEMRYTTLSGSHDRIKLEINYLHRLPIINLNTRVFKRFGLDIKFLQLGLEELIATKIIALLSRYTPRDLYDIYQVSKSNLNLNDNQLSQLVLYYGLIARENISDLYQLKIDNITGREINRHLFPMLTNSENPVLDEMRDSVVEFLKPIIQLKKSQLDAIEAFYSTGELHPDSLFEHADIYSRVLESPGFRWKIANIMSNK